MNKRNNWQYLLNLANEDLKKGGLEIRITDFYNDGCYTCEIYDGNISKMVYAENYYENELSDLVCDALAYAKENFSKIKGFTK